MASASGSRALWVAYGPDLGQLVVAGDHLPVPLHQPARPHLATRLFVGHSEKDRVPGKPRSGAHEMASEDGSHRRGLVQRVRE